MNWFDTTANSLRVQSIIYWLAINPIIYAELSLTFSSVKALDQALDDLGLAEVSPAAPLR